MRQSMKTASALALLVFLAACGGGGNPVVPPPPTPPPVPAATITATGAGALVIHPSINPNFAVAMETPIRVTETSGGSADWNFVRMQFFRSGQEIERTELGADQIRAAGFSRIAANSNSVYTVVFRFSSSNFDRIDTTLGFGDVKDGRQFTAAVPFGSFTGVNLSLTPLRFAYSPDPL